ncbi:MAG TPA: hypothetical protein VG253_25595 [Streptosporangiaceae bacterium]|nr:hypothetical protein [Streptosporangiaceae bacterium]
MATVEYPGIAEPMRVVRFPDGGRLSIEFTGQAPDDDHPRPGHGSKPGVLALTRTGPGDTGDASRSGLPGLPGGNR